MEETFVIARWNEDINPPENSFIVQKDEHLPNKGREPSSYFWYIHEFYDSLEGLYKFRQANDHEHQVDKYNHYSDWDGKPHHPVILPIKEVADKLGIEIPEQLHFTAGCQIDRTAEQIKKHPKEFYKNAMEVCMEDDLYPYCIERLLNYIIPQ